MNRTDKLVFLISLLYLSNAFQISASEVYGLHNQDVEESKEVAETTSLSEFQPIKKELKSSKQDSNSELDLENQYQIEQYKKAQEEKEKKEFENLYSKYPKEVNAVVEALQSLHYLNSDYAHSGFPRDVAKLIAKYCESSNYEHNHTFTAHEKLNNPSVFELNNGDLASSSFDNTIKIWRSKHDKKFQCIQVLEKAGFVQSFFQLKNGDLATCALDHNIKIWQLNSVNKWQLKQNLRGHTDFVKSVIQLNNGDLASYSSDCTIKIWSLNHQNGVWECKQTLHEHTNEVESLIQLNNHTLVSSSFEVIKIWHLNPDNIWQCKQTIRKQYQHIIKLNNGDFATWDSEIKIWQQSPKDDLWGSVKTLKQPDVFGTCYYSLIQLSDGDLASASWDRKCGHALKIWHKIIDNEWECIQILNPYSMNRSITHYKGLRSITQLKNGDLFSICYDGTKQIWHKNVFGKWQYCQTLVSNEELQLSIQLKNEDLVCYWGNDNIEIFQKPFDVVVKDDDHDDNYILKLYEFIKSNTIKTSTAIVYAVLLFKYRNKLTTLFRK